MSSVTRPRGSLPARVYWFRRGLVLATALALVFAIARLLGGGGTDPQQASEAAAPAAAKPSATPTKPRIIGPVAVTSVRPKGRKTKVRAQAPAQPLAQPSGPCQAAEVLVVPAITSARAGDKISLPLDLTSTEPACTFEVTPESLVVKVVSGSDRIWSTQECPRAVKRQTVVVRSAVPARVNVTWSGRRSDDSCSSQTKWAMPGWYHAIAAAIGSEPSDQQFRLTLPPRSIVTQTVAPKPKKKH